MPTDSYKLLILGGVISFFSSMLMFLASSVQGWMNKKEEREWLLKVKIRDEEIAIRKKKVDVAESSLKKIYKTAANIAEWEINFSSYAYAAIISGSYLGIVYLYKNGTNADLTKYLKTKNFNKKMLIKNIPTEKAIQNIKDEFNELDRLRKRQIEIIQELDIFSDDVLNLFSTNLEVIKKTGEYSGFLIRETNNIERLLDVY